MSLRDRLDRERQEDRADPALARALDATFGELLRRGTGEAALRAGDEFPDFLLPDAEGRLVSRDELLAGGPAAITFFRGEWCPYCCMALDALEAALPRIVAAGGTLAAITPETGGRALAAKQAVRASYRVLVDVDHGLAAGCGLAFRVPEPYRRILMGFGLDLAVHQGNEAWLLPVPATFVVGRDARVTWAFVDADFTRRAEPDDVVAALLA
jgi:peroxiredoxin